MKLIILIPMIVLNILLMSCSANKTAIKLAEPPQGFIPMAADAPGKEKISAYAEKRIAVFAQQDTTTFQNGTVFLGNSITERFPVETLFPNLKVINRGIGGDTMGGIRHYGVLNRLDSTVYNLHPKRIILMIGVNDIIFSAGTPFDQKLIQYDYLVWKIRHDLPETELWCISVLPVRGRYAAKNADIIKFNVHAKLVAKKYGAKWLDIYSKFLDTKKELKQEYAADSVHPSPAGYELLTKIYRARIFGKS